jgi:hypothetical protein
VDVTCYAQSVEYHSGRVYSVDTFAPSTAVLTFTNADGWATQSQPNQLDIRPGRQVRVMLADDAVGGSGRVPVWRGYVDSITPTYDAEQWDVVQFDCIDAVGEVGTYSQLEVAVPVGAGEVATSRLTRLLDTAGWPSSKRVDWDASSVTLLGTSLSSPWVDEIGQVADSEGGAVLADADVAIRFRNRDWMTYSPRTPDTFIGNSGVDGEVCPSS